MSKISISNVNLDGARKIRSKLAGYINSPLSSIVQDKVVLSTVQEALDDLGYGAQLRVHVFGYDGIWGGSTEAALIEFRNDYFTQSTLTEALMELMSKISDSIKDDYFLDKAYVGLDNIMIHHFVRDGRQRVEVRLDNDAKEFTKFRNGYYTNGVLPIDTGNKIIDAVAPIEGRMDAINTWDDSFLSVGPFQWTLGQKGRTGELANLISDFYVEYPKEFKTLLETYGLGVEPHPERDGVYLSIYGELLDTPEKKEQLRSPKWCFVFWRLCNTLNFQKVMFKYMLHRVEQVKSIKISDELRIGDLFTNQYALAQLLQCHVNRPAYVDDYVRKAIDEVMDCSVSDLVDQKLPNELQSRIVDAIQPIAVNYGKYPMTHPETRFDRVRESFGR